MKKELKSVSDQIRMNPLCAAIGVSGERNRSLADQRKINKIKNQIMTHESRTIRNPVEYQVRSEIGSNLYLKLK